MLVFDELIRARLENLSADPTLTDATTAIALANSLKTVTNAHAADAAQHTTAIDNVNYPIATADATDLASLYTLTGALLTAYDSHDADAELASGWAYHAAQELSDYSLDSAVTPTTLLQATTRLNNLKAKYNAHDTDGTTHGVASSHQESTANASTSTGEVGRATYNTTDGRIKLDDGAKIISLGSNSETFTSSGVFTAPTGVTKVYVEMVGGGGGGGGSDASDHGGGGSACFPSSFYYDVTPTASYAIVIGAGGAGGAINSDGSDGAVSSFDSISSRIGYAGSHKQAGGGIDGAASGNNGGAGIGGDIGSGAKGTGIGFGSNGVGVVIAGGYGGGGSGGGTGGSSWNGLYAGGNALGTAKGGGGGASIFAAGADGGANAGGAGSAGTLGSGGGGATGGGSGYPGGSGGDGCVVVHYVN